jgi:biopolymer transport protein ExbD
MALLLLTAAAAGCRGESQPCRCKSQSPIESYDLRFPKASTGSELDAQATAVVIVGRDGSLRYAGKQLTRKSLRQLVLRDLEQNPKLRLIVSAARDVPHGHVIAALDALRTAGVTRYSVTLEGKTPPY